jgi:hypothetical protein
VTFLGAPTPAASLAEYVAELDADAVGISCTVPEHLLGAARSIAAAKAAGAIVVCGGAAFGATARRARNLGAHGWLGGVDKGFDLDRCLFDDPLPTPLFGEWNVIEDNADLLVAEAMEWLIEEEPELLAPGEPERRRCRDELRSSLRTGATAVLTEDPLIVTEHLLWLRGYRSWAHRDGSLTRAALDALAAVTTRVAPHVSGLLSHAARIDS